MGDKDQLQMGDKDQQRKAMENQYIKTSTQDNHRLSKLPPPPPQIFQIFTENNLARGTGKI